MEERNRLVMAMLGMWLLRFSRGVCLSMAVGAGLASVFLFAMAAMVYNARADFRKSAHRVEAEIVAVHQKTDPVDHATLWVPELSFRDMEGNRHTVSLPGTSDAGTYATGATVPLLYKDYDPTIVRLDSGDGTSLAPKAFICMGVASLLAGAVFVWLYAVQRRRTLNPAPCNRPS